MCSKPLIAESSVPVSNRKVGSARGHQPASILSSSVQLWSKSDPSRQWSVFHRNVVSVIVYRSGDKNHQKVCLIRVYDRDQQMIRFELDLRQMFEFKSKDPWLHIFLVRNRWTGIRFRDLNHSQQFLTLVLEAMARRYVRMATIPAPMGRQVEVWCKASLEPLKDISVNTCSSDGNDITTPSASDSSGRRKCCTLDDKWTQTETLMSDPVPKALVDKALNAVMAAIDYIEGHIPEPKVRKRLDKPFGMETIDEEVDTRDKSLEVVSSDRLEQSSTLLSGLLMAAKGLSPQVDSRIESDYEIKDSEEYEYYEEIENRTPIDISLRHVWESNTNPDPMVLNTTVQSLDVTDGDKCDNQLIGEVLKVFDDTIDYLDDTKDMKPLEKQHETPIDISLANTGTTSSSSSTLTHISSFKVSTDKESHDSDGNGMWKWIPKVLEQEFRQWEQTFPRIDFQKLFLKSTSVEGNDNRLETTGVTNDKTTGDVTDGKAVHSIAYHLTQLTSILGTVGQQCHYMSNSYHKKSMAMTDKIMKKLSKANCQTMSTIVLELFLWSPDESTTKWHIRRNQTLCLVCDENTGAYSLRVFDSSTGRGIWSRELGSDFGHKIPDLKFLVLEPSDGVAGIVSHSVAENIEFCLAVNRLLTDLRDGRDGNRLELEFNGGKGSKRVEKGIKRWLNRWKGKGCVDSVMGFSEGDTYDRKAAKKLVDSQPLHPDIKSMMCALIYEHRGYCPGAA